MRNLREISWWDLVAAYKYLFKYKFLPKEMDHYCPVGQSKENYCHILAYVIEKLTDEQKHKLNPKIIQLYNFIFMDEREKINVGGYEPTFPSLEKNDEFGSRIGSQAALINFMLRQGGHTQFNIAKAAGTTENRVRSHVAALRRRLKDEIEIVSIRRGRRCAYYVKEKKHGNKRKSSKRITASTFE